MRIDLHRHLEGSHTPQALARVAERHQIRAPLFYDAAASRFQSPDEIARALVMTEPSDDAGIFYNCIKAARVAYVSLPAVEDLAREAFLDTAAEADAFELRVSLFSMARTLLENTQVDWRALPPAEFAERCREVLLAVLRARDEARRQTGKPMVLRLGFSRTFESEAHYAAMAEVAAEHARELVGLDILGIVGGEDREPLPEALVAIVQKLRKVLPDLTVHAGEFEGHGSVLRTLELEPQGIGHGVHSVESDETMARLSREGVTLEVCPSSNRLLIPSALKALVEKRQAHPLVALQRADVHCVLGSDDPVPFGTRFPRELEIAQALGADLGRLDADTGRRWRQITGG